MDIVKTLNELAEKSANYPRLELKFAADRIVELESKLSSAEKERDGWKDSAAHFSDGMEFYRGIVRRIGALYGVEARTSDDGSVQEDVLALKVPELVEHYMKQAAEIAEQLKGSSLRLHSEEIAHAQTVANFQSMVASWADERSSIMGRLEAGRKAVSDFLDAYDAAMPDWFADISALRAFVVERGSTVDPEDQWKPLNFKRPSE